MTLAETRGIKPPEEEPPHGHAQAHPGPGEYIRIGVILAFVTAVEVALFYADIRYLALVVALIVLSFVKFSMVVAWFMHLKFDSRIFSWFFVGGILLASSLFVVVLASLGGGLT
jgi:cytochrome c oxidase subunit 4